MSFPKGIIVSCQAKKGEAFYNPEGICMLAKCAEMGGAVALRVNGAKNVENCKLAGIKIPIIGLAKKTINGVVLITPLYEYAKQLKDAGADYIAVDATGRVDSREMHCMLDMGVPIIGDIATIEQAIVAEHSGFYAITTALAGYFGESTSPYEPPNTALLCDCVRVEIDIPIIAEGRYWKRADVKKAFDLGASAVCLGSPITRPQVITQYYCEWEKE